jgi:hypothetical protein
MEDNVYNHKVVRLLVFGFVALVMTIATCQHLDYRVRANSPGFRHQQIELRLDDDHGKNDSKVLQVPEQ